MNTTVISSLDLLAPKVSAAAKEAIAAANAAGYPVKAFETYRMPERQHYLYEKGRSTPGRIVTNKDANYSWHQYCVALDIAFFVNGAWSWDGNFSAVSRFFLAQGFEWLHPFEDVHFQMVNKWQVADAITLTRSGTLQDLWEAMGLA